MRRALAIVLALLPFPAAVQGLEPALADSRILTIVPDQLFEDSQAGKAAEARIDAASNELVAENRRLEAELEAEERNLTARRGTMPTADFRALADAFDAKAVRVRKEQDEKARQIARMREQDRQTFFNAVAPVLAEMMQSEKAVAILDRSSVFLSFDLIDVTDRAIAAVDAKLGDGGDLFETGEAAAAP